MARQQKQFYTGYPASKTIMISCILKNFLKSCKKVKKEVFLLEKKRKKVFFLQKKKYRKRSYFLNNLFCWEFCCKEINFGFVHLVIIPKLTLSCVIIFIAVILRKESILTPQKYALFPPASSPLQ